MIQDDPEFKVYLSSQDDIANRFLEVLGLDYKSVQITQSLEDSRFPSPAEVFGELAN